MLHPPLLPQTEPSMSSLEESRLCVATGQGPMATTLLQKDQPRARENGRTRIDLRRYIQMVCHYKRES